MNAHFYLPLSVRQFTLLYYVFFLSQCCYNLFFGIVLFDFPYCGCNHYSFYHVSFLSSTMYMYLSLFPLLYSLMSPRLYSYALLLHRTTCYLCILLPFCGQVVIYIYIASSVTLWSFRNIIGFGVKLMIGK